MGRRCHAGIVQTNLNEAREWVGRAGGRALFLLGAGASKPALPVSAELTEIVLASIDEATLNFAAESRVPELWRGIRPVLASMGSNIEDLYQAVETLTYQDSDPTRFWVKGFMEFPTYGGDTAELARDAHWILDMIQGHTLGALDTAQADAPLGHFEPLLRAAKTGIVTLNYDQLIERAGEKFGVEVSTGAELWDGGFQWQFETGAVPLLKMHGSMTWRGSRSINHESGNLLPAVGFYETRGLNEAAPNRLLTPTVIFGSGSKTTPFSAFPALTRQFHDWLEESELLVVVGYSFRDQHVDAAIRRWASLSASRRIIVIDPSPRRYIGQGEDTLGGLLWAMDAEYRTPDADVPSVAATFGKNRMIFLIGGVESFLPVLVA